MKSWSFFSNVQTNEEAKKNPKKHTPWSHPSGVDVHMFGRESFTRNSFLRVQIDSNKHCFSTRKIESWREFSDVKLNISLVTKQKWLLLRWESSWLLFINYKTHTREQTHYESCLFDIVAFWITIYLWFYKIIFKNFTSLNDCKIYL